MVTKVRHNPMSAVNYGSTKYSTLDGSLVDSFGRMRVSEPESLFDSKQLFDTQPLFWDDQVISGAGTSTAFSANTASTTLAVSDGTAGKRARQTFQSFNYQPGKGQMVAMTGILGAGEPGISTALGMFDDTNGIMFEVIDGTPSVNIRSFATGSAVNSRVVQSDWNLDSMGGLGPSLVTLDFSMTQIFHIDFQWLGVGRVRMGFFVDGALIYCHEFLNANVITVPYISQPNLPLRYEIENDGAGGAASIVHMCSKVASEGGAQNIGVLQYESTTTNRAGSTTHVSADVADTGYALIGIRIKSAYIGTVVNLESVSVLAETNTSFEWLVLFNPTIAGTFTYADKANSAMQTAIGNADVPSTNTVTATGTVIGGGLIHSSGAGGARGGSVTEEFKNALRLGANIAATADTLVLAVKPLAVDADIHGGIIWRELS